MNSKTIWMGLCIGLMCFLGSCQVDQFEPLEPTTEQDELIFKAKPTSASVAPVHHGFYVNNFYSPDPVKNILGDQQKEDDLLAWTLVQGFESISLYTIGQILSPSNTALVPALEAFVDKAKNEYALNVYFSAGGLQGIGRISDYCADHAMNTNQLPSGIVTEYEFWNDGNSFTVYHEMLDILEDMIETYDFERSFLYISKFEDAGYDNSRSTNETESRAADGGYCPAQVMYLVLNKIRQVGEDRLFISLVNYRTNAQNMPSTTSSYYERLQRLATMASPANGPFITVPHHNDCSYGTRLNMHLHIALLFNVNYNSNDPDMFNYFSVTGDDNTFDEAFESFVAQYESSAITNKDRLIIEGNQIYRYKEAIEARP